VSTAARTRTRPQGAPELDPALDSPLDLELADRERTAALDGVPGAPREPGLRRYLRWQARDFLRHRAVFLVPLALLAVWIFHYNYDPALVAEQFANGNHPGGMRSEPQMFRAFSLGLGLAGSVAASILAVAGIVSREREGGQQRFLFAKPVRITSYYLQSFAVSGVGTLAVVALSQLVIALAFGRAVPIGEVMLGAAAAYVAVGGLTFLMSTIVRFDLAIAGLLTILSVPLHAAAQEGKWWAVMTSWLLPPIHQFEHFFREGGRGGGVSGLFGAVGTMVAYGAAYVAAGWAALKRRSIIR
jgi:hypothetical protein